MKPLLIITTVCLLSMFSCDKPGFEGKSMVFINTYNGSFAAPYSIVYLKFGDSLYDSTLTDDQYDFIDTADYTGAINVGLLKRGDYYFFSKFIDSTDNVPVIYKGGEYLRIQTKPSDYHVVIDFNEDNPF